MYVSNESPQNVYFDNLTVKQITGPLQQEQSFYPFGLPMAGISDKALLKKTTIYKANGGTELEEDYGLEYYNTGARKYDPQIGRFSAIDAMAESTGGLSPYHFVGNNPVSGIDPFGLLVNRDALRQEQAWENGGGGGGGWVEGDLDNAEAWGDDAYFDGGGGSGGGGGGSASQVDGGYAFTGAAAQAVWGGLLNAYNNANADGDWGFTVGSNNGAVGYWQQYSYTYDAGYSLQGVGVGKEFEAFGDGGGKEGVSAESLNLGKNPTVEQILQGLWNMKTNDYITGKELGKLNPNFSKAGLAVNSITRVNTGLKVDLKTLFGKPYINFIPHLTLNDGDVIKLETDLWPDGKTSVLKLTSSDTDIRIPFLGNTISLPIYVNNNAYTNQFSMKFSWQGFFKGGAW